MTGIEPELWVGRAASAVGDWRVGRIVDPFGHEREIGRPEQSVR